MREIYFDDLRLMVAGYIREIDNTSPQNSSIEWFLLRYMKRIVKATESPAQSGRVEGTVKALVRFYVDNIDEKSETGRICINIYEQYRKTLRDSQMQNQKSGR